MFSDSEVTTTISYGSRKNLIIASTLCTVLFCLSQKRSLI